MIRFYGFVSLWLCSGRVFSAASDAVASIALARPAAVAARTAEGFDAGMLGQLLAGLVLVLLVFMGLAWLIRRSGAAGGFSQQGLKVLATLPLSTRERVVLVQAGSQQLLLGVAPGRVNLLQSFDQPLIEVPVATSPPFSQWLQRAKASMAARSDEDGAPHA